jgi:hypothetical protein
LGQNIGAVTILFHHTLQAANLIFDSTEPPQVRRFNPRLDRYCFAAGQIRVVRAQTIFARILFQHVLRWNHIFIVPLCEFSADAIAGYSQQH